jgi:VanZ family protein
MPRPESPANSRSADGRPAFLVRLGVGLPCTPQDVEQAYLEKVKQAHPDRGGTQEDFLELQDAYAQAKEFAKFQASRRGWLGDSIERYALQQEFIGEIQSRGGQVDVRQLDWLAGEIGEDFAQVMETIDSVALVGPKFDDATIAALVKRQDILGQIHGLNLTGSRVTDAGAAKLTAFAYLRRLDLSGTGVSNAALKTCARLTKLEWLGVVHTRVNRLGRFWLRVARPDLDIARAPAIATHGFRSYAPALAVVCVLYLALMVVATHMSLSRVAVPQWRLLPFDKVFHFSAYAGLAFLLATLAAAIWTGTQGKRRTRFLRYAAVLPVVALYGVIDEVTQPMVGRTMDGLDWLADITGAATGLVLFFIARFALKRLAERRWARLSAQRLVPIG